MKIKITNFQVAFGGTKLSGGFVGSNGFVGMSGEWNALVSYSVVLLDDRNVSNTFKSEISEISSGSAMTTVGITTTNLMTKAYAKSTQSLVNFIETSLSSW